jgi:hypothetical protein
MLWASTLDWSIVIIGLDGYLKDYPLEELQNFHRLTSHSLTDDNAADPDQAPKPAKADKPGVRGGKLAPAPSKSAPTQREERPFRGGGDRGRGGYRRGGGEGGGT